MELTTLKLSEIEPILNSRTPVSAAHIDVLPNIPESTQVNVSNKEIRYVIRSVTNKLKVNFDYELNGDVYTIKRGLSPTRAWYFNDIILSILDTNIIFGDTQDLPIVKEYSKEFVPLSYLKRSEVSILISEELQIKGGDGTVSIRKSHRKVDGDTRFIRSVSRFGLSRITGVYVIVK